MITRVNITNTFGQAINVEFNGKKINVQNLNSGIYFLHIATANNNYTLKFIKE